MLMKNFFIDELYITPITEWKWNTKKNENMYLKFVKQMI